MQSQGRRSKWQSLHLANGDKIESQTNFALPGENRREQANSTTITTRDGQSIEILPHSVSLRTSDGFVLDLPYSTEKPIQYQNKDGTRVQLKTNSNGTVVMTYTQKGEGETTIVLTAGSILSLTQNSAHHGTTVYDFEKRTKSHITTLPLTRN